MFVGDNFASHFSHAAERVTLLSYVSVLSPPFPWGRIVTEPTGLEGHTWHGRGSVCTLA